MAVLWVMEIFPDALKQLDPFGLGVQRIQMCELLMSNWIGNKGLIRRFQIALRKPVHYGDITTYTGEVVKKFKEIQSGKGDG